MKTTFRTGRHGAQGFALIITMVFLLVSLIIFGSIMYWVSSNAKLTLRNNQFNSSEYAAEAAVEKVLSQMDHDFLAQSLTTATWYATSLLPNQTGWPIGYTYSDTNGISSQISVYLGPTSPYTVPLTSEYTNLYGFVQTNTITATATPASASGAGSNWVYNVPATINEQLELASIPLFQFAIFYNINLEICPGSAMTIKGPVFSNQSIWEGSQNTTFSSTVSAVGTNDLAATDPFATSYAPQSVPATFSFAGQPTSKNDALTMPIAGATNSSPTNVEAIINLPPSTYALGTSAAYTTNGQLYLANEADLIITNTSSGTNWGGLPPVGTNTFVYYQDSYNTPYLTLIPPDYYLLKKPWTNGVIGTFTNYVSTNLNAKIDCVTNVQFAGYSFLTNVTFKDWRESDTVQALQIDVALFNRWLNNNPATNSAATNSGYSYNQTCDSPSDKHHTIDSIFAYNGVQLTSTTIPAVRVVNGQQLNNSYGFTVVTPMPMYVWGNYNIQQSSAGPYSLTTNGTSYTYPAALMADAITILSTNWSDSYTNEDPTGTTHGPGDTTVNAAMLEGIVQSNPNISGNYSGGVENFLRLLEDWGNNGTSGHRPILTYNGSIVVMFPSIYATNSWGGGYYGVPQRNWSFDTNFEAQSGLPPLTPESKAVIRGQWSAY